MALPSQEHGLRHVTCVGASPHMWAHVTWSIGTWAVAYFLRPRLDRCTSMFPDLAQSMHVNLSVGNLGIA